MHLLTEYLKKLYPSKIKLALVSCVRNESEKIYDFLMYHHSLGVTRAYIFLDRCSDNTEEILKKISWVKVIKKNKIASFMGEHQNECANEALNYSLNEGFDWLLHIDVDEFAWGNNSLNQKSNSPFEEGSLLKMLSTVNPETEMVVLTTREIIPPALDETSEFWQLKYVFIHDYVVRAIYNPLKKCMVEKKGFLGHNLGKSIIRVSNKFQAYDPHSWTIQQGCKNPKLFNIPTEYKGWINHYFITSFQNWWDKFHLKSEFPSTWRNGKAVPFPKQAWKEFLPRISHEEAKDYYGKWVGVDQNKIDQYVFSGAALETTQVVNIISHLKYS